MPASTRDFVRASFQVPERNYRPKSDVRVDPARTSSAAGAAPFRETAPFLLLLVVLGAWQHIYFSHSVGELAFFKNGYDEDTYLLIPFGLAGWRPDRMLSGAIATAFITLFNGSYSSALIAFDTLFPPSIFAAAYFVGSALFRERLARALFAFVLMFSSDLFSLGSIASFPGPFPTLAQFAHLVGEVHVPPIETSFLSIYRSPEPQVAYLVSYVFVGLLLRISFGLDALGNKAHTIRLIAVQLLLLGCYAIISYPLMLIEGAIAVLLFVGGRRREAILLGSLCAISVAVMMVSAKAALEPLSTAVFANRQPVITVSSLLALVLMTAILMLALRDRKAWARLAVAFLFAAMPLALTNQQIITGTMVSVRDWERTLNLALVIISAGIIFSTTGWRFRGQRWAIGIAMALVGIFVARASERTYRMWLPDNQKSLAIARAVRAAWPELPRDTQWVLYQPEFAPFVKARLGREFGRQFYPLLDYTEAFRTPIPSTSSFAPTRLSAFLFEYWRQVQMPPENASNILVEEARSRSGYYSAFLFNLCEYWSPCSDGRHVQTIKISAAIPSVVDAYAGYLKAPHPPSNPAFVGVNLAIPQRGRLIGAGQVGDISATAVLKD